MEEISASVKCRQALKFASFDRISAPILRKIGRMKRNVLARNIFDHLKAVSICQVLLLCWLYYRLCKIYFMSRKVSASSKQNPLTLRNLSTLADVLKEKGRLNEAAEFYRKGLEGREEILGVDHPSTLEVVNSLALLLEEKKNFDESEALFKRALEGRTKMFGEFHPQTCDTAFNLGDLYRKLGRYKPAAEMYRHAVQGYSENLGIKHNNTIVTLQRLDELSVLESQQCRCILS